MRIPVIRPAAGSKDRWILIYPWHFAHDDITRTIPAGYKFDLASIPRVARSIVQKTDRRTWGPALEHDFRYEYRIGPRKRADKEFRKALVLNGVSSFKAYLCYLAVRLGGKKAWDNN